MMQRIRWFLLILGIIVLLVLGLANQTSVPVKMPLVFEAELPLAMLLAATSAISFVLGALLTGWMLRSRGKEKPEKKEAAETTAAEPTPLDTAESNPLI
jgi:uncharacterized integral membrane protein